MNTHSVWITPPTFAGGDAIWFSAFAFGWGYCAFSIPFNSVCEHLGAADISAKQLIVAFELGKKRIAKTVELTVIPANGERVTLTDLSADVAAVNYPAAVKVDSDSLQSARV